MADVRHRPTGWVIVLEEQQYLGWGRESGKRVREEGGREGGREEGREEWRVK